MSPSLTDSADNHNITPSWLTQNYMEAALRVYKNNNELHIREFHITPALGKGENYDSIIYRVKVDYITENTNNNNNSNNESVIKSSFIVKTSLEGDESIQEKIEAYEFIKHEMQMYADIVPKLNNILKEIGEHKTMFVEAVKVDFENSAMVFNDLNAAGYEMADRKLGLDIAHIKLVLKNLAKMHVASIILNQREGGSLERYDRGFFNRHSDLYKTYFVENIKACGRTLIASETLNMSGYGQKLLNLTRVYMELGARVFDVLPQQLNVLNHGDIWTNNMMFKYDRETAKPVDVIFLDFQFVVWTTPAVDLHYVFNTSLREDIRLQEQDALFQYYHKELNTTFVAFQVDFLKIPSLHQFHIEMLEKQFYALHASCAVQPVILNESTDNADYDALIGVDERAIKFKNSLYENEKVQDYLCKLLPKFERLGLLETEQ